MICGVDHFVFLDSLLVGRLHRRRMTDDPMRQKVVSHSDRPGCFVKCFQLGGRMSFCINFNVLRDP